jgi:integrase
VGMFLGLRASEILGLRWEDFDFFEKSVHIQRSVVGKHEEDTKTEDSEAFLPIPDALMGILERWRAYLPSVGGWLLGNPAAGTPYHRDSIVADHLKPAGERAGVCSAWDLIRSGTVIGRSWQITEWQRNGSNA